MSGGQWNYRHDDLFRAADEIEKMAARNPYGDTADTIAEYSRAARVMREAAIYWRRIDWLVSCDDGPESFHRRLQKELTALRQDTFTYEE